MPQSDLSFPRFHTYHTVCRIISLQANLRLYCILEEKNKFGVTNFGLKYPILLTLFDDYFLISIKPWIRAGHLRMETFWNFIRYEWMTVPQGPLLDLVHMYTLTKGVLINCAKVGTFIVNFSLLHLLWHDVYIEEQALSFDLMPHMWKSVKNWLQESHVSAPWRNISNVGTKMTTLVIPYLHRLDTVMLQIQTLLVTNFKK